MILRRLADAITAQNWVTVVLEVLIVVVGLFIGLQVDDWNEARKDRAAETEYLERLLADTALNLEQVSVKAQNYLDRAESLSRIVEHLNAAKADEIDVDDLTNAFCYWYLPEGIRLYSTTYDEMTSTGRIELIRDRNLRQLLELTWAEHIRSKDEYPRLSALQVDLAKPIANYTEWRFDAPIHEIDVSTGNVPLQAGCVVDRAALMANPDISSLLVQLNRSQTILGNLHLDEQNALEELLIALEKAVAN